MKHPKAKEKLIAMFMDKNEGLDIRQLISMLLKDSLDEETQLEVLLETLKAEKQMQIMEKINKISQDSKFSSLENALDLITHNLKVLKKKGLADIIHRYLSNFSYYAEATLLENIEKRLNELDRSTYCLALNLRLLSWLISELNIHA